MSEGIDTYQINSIGCCSKNFNVYCKLMKCVFIPRRRLFLWEPTSKIDLWFKDTPRGSLLAEHLFQDCFGKVWLIFWFFLDSITSLYLPFHSIGGLLLACLCYSFFIRTRLESLCNQHRQSVSPSVSQSLKVLILPTIRFFWFFAWS